MTAGRQPPANAPLIEARDLKPGFVIWSPDGPWTVQGVQVTEREVWVRSRTQRRAFRFSLLTRVYLLAPDGERRSRNQDNRVSRMVVEARKQEITAAALVAMNDDTLTRFALAAGVSIPMTEEGLTPFYGLFHDVVERLEKLEQGAAEHAQSMIEAS